MMKEGVPMKKKVIAGAVVVSLLAALMIPVSYTHLTLPTTSRV